jgi:heptosyltransferase-1
VRLLVVKTSSMGDVVHAMPVVGDILRRHPQAQIDWLVEAPFAAIAQLHPGIGRVWPMAWRKWRGQLASRATWRAMGQLRGGLRSAKYDLVLDLQGLIKSALWARQAGARSPVTTGTASASRWRRGPISARRRCHANCMLCSAAACSRLRIWVTS